MYPFLEENQMLSVGQELFYLVPREGNFCRSFCLAGYFGKVKLNQR